MIATALEKLLSHDLLFVTGTDTGVGKTVLTTAIATHWKRGGHEVCAVKPVAAGDGAIRGGHWVCDDSRASGAACTPAGAALLESVLGVAHDSPMIGLSQPIAPWSAAELDQRVIDVAGMKRDLRRLARAARRSNIRLIIEGAGGILVPLGPRHTMADLARSLRAPVVVVARSALGTINHTLLTLEALGHRGIPVAGVILNRMRGGCLSAAESAGVRELSILVPRATPLLIAGRAGRGGVGMVDARG